MDQATAPLDACSTLRTLIDEESQSVGPMIAKHRQKLSRRRQKFLCSDSLHSRAKSLSSSFKFETHIQKISFLD